MLKKFFSEFKNLSLSERLLVALVFTLPFERTPSYDVYGLTIKLSLVVGLAFIAVNLRKTLASFRGMNHFLRLPRVFLELSLLSALWAENLSYWFKANLILGFCVVLFYATVSLVKESENRERLISLLLKTVLVSALVAIMFGLFQWLGDLMGLPSYLTAIRPEYTADKLGLPRMHSVLLEPLYFGLYLLLPLGILWADRAGALVKNLYLRLGLIALIYLSILLSLARGAIVASAFIGILGLIYNFKEVRRQLKSKDLLKIAGVGLASLAILVAATSLLGVKGKDEDHNYEKGFSTIVGHLETIKPWGSQEDAAEANSINSRDESRSEAWGMITRSKDNFIFGVGAGQYGANLNPPKGFEDTSNFVILDVWAEYGFVGLALLSVFIGYILVALMGSRKARLTPAERVIVVGVGIYLVGFLIQSISFGELAIVHLWVALALATSLCSSYSSGSAESEV